MTCKGCSGNFATAIKIAEDAARSAKRASIMAALSAGCSLLLTVLNIVKAA